MIKKINIQQTKKKALDLFDPKVLDRIKTLQKSKKKEAPKKYQPNPAYLSNIYQLGIPHENIKKTLPAPNYYKSSKKTTNYKSSIAKLPKKNTVNSLNSASTNTTVTINKITPILTQPKNHTQYYSHIPNVTQSKPPAISIQEPINLPRRIHSPKTVWRLLRKQKRKYSNSVSNTNITKKKYKKKNSKTSSLKKNTTTTNTNKPSRRPLEKVKIKNNNNSSNSGGVRNVNNVNSNKNSSSKSDSNNNGTVSKTKTINKKSEKTKNKKPNTKSKKQNKPTFLMLDKIADVKARYKKRKTIRQNLKKLNRKKIIFYLARRNIVEWNSNAPLKVLKDLYLAARSMGDVYVQKM